MSIFTGRIFGIEESTDLSRRATKVREFRSLAAAQAWLAASTNVFSDPGAANHAPPVDGQNFHHQVREVYRLPPGWRKPSFRRVSLRDIRKSNATLLAEAIYRAGKMLELEGCEDDYSHSRSRRSPDS